jgi:hypothetical protein
MTTRKERREAFAVRDRHIVELAFQGNSPTAIHILLGRRVSVNVISNVLTRAKKAGVKVPGFRSGTKRLGKGQSTLGEYTKPGNEPAAGERSVRSVGADRMTPEDDRRLIDLVGRGVRLTAVAAHLRKPYRTINDAMLRLGLSRVSPR